MNLRIVVVLFFVTVVAIASFTVGSAQQASRGWDGMLLLVLVATALVYGVGVLRGRYDQSRIHQVLHEVQMRNVSMPSVRSTKDELEALRVTLSFLGTALSEEREKTQTQLAFRKRVCATVTEAITVCRPAPAPSDTRMANRSGWSGSQRTLRHASRFNRLFWIWLMA